MEQNKSDLKCSIKEKREKPKKSKANNEYRGNDFKY